MDDHWPTLHEDPFARARLKRSCELLNCVDGDSVLDVGCHHSEALEFLPPEIEYLGLDYIHGDDFDGGLKITEKYDRILCLELLEHLKYPKKTLASLASLLEPTGTMVISLPNEATLFHRLRSFFGTPDQECFSEDGKHLHLPSLRQAYSFVSKYMKVQKVEYYISDGCGSHQKFLTYILKGIPKKLLQFLADIAPSLFSRGFIFVCVNRH